MPRKHAQFNVTIWNDEDYRVLPMAAQWLYKTLWTHPGLSYCGVLDWRPGKIAARCSDLTAADVATIADCLEARHFIVRDLDSEECLIRSWVRWDGLLNQPRLTVSYANAYAEVASATLRRVIVHEAQKLHDREPGLVGWQNKAVLELLSRDGLDAKSKACPSDPFGHGLGPGLGMGLGVGLGQTQSGVSVPPTPAPAPSSITPAPATSEISDLDAPRAEVIELCDYLAEQIEANGSKRPTVSAKWLSSCRLMIDRDGRTVEEIRGAITWCQGDEFWRANVLSFPTLREKFDRLRLDATRKRRPTQQQHTDDIFARAQAWAAEQEANAS